VTYKTSALFGDIDESSLVFKFAQESVNYDTFNQETLGAVTNFAGLSFAVATTVVFLLW
jgi:hypothetical protein